MPLIECNTLEEFCAAAAAAIRQVKAEDASDEAARHPPPELMPLPDAVVPAESGGAAT